MIHANGAGDALLMGAGSYTSTKNGTGKETGKWGSMPKAPAQKPGAKPAPRLASQLKIVKFGEYAFAQPPSLPESAKPPQSSQMPPMPEPKVQIKSLGTLEAQGSGMASVILQKGTVTIAGKGDLNVSSDAKVTIKGNPGKKTVQNFGGRQGNRGSMRGIVNYMGFNGEATISADHRTNMNLRGSSIVIHGRGVGDAVLMGDGSYTGTKSSTSGKESGKWGSLPKSATSPGQKPGPAVMTSASNHLVVVRFGDYSYPPMPEPKVQIKAQGTVEAQGSGRVNVILQKGTVTIAGKGDFSIGSDAKVTFKGNPGTKTVQNAGNQPNNPLGGMMAGLVEYKDFDGEATFSVEKRCRASLTGLPGSNITVHGNGAGDVVLMGDGSYTSTKNGAEGKETGKWGPKPPAPGAVKTRRTAGAKAAPEGSKVRRLLIRADARRSHAACSEALIVTVKTQRRKGI